MTNQNSYTPAQVLAFNKQFVTYIFTVSHREQSLEAGLAQVNGDPVEVYLVKANAISNYAGSHSASTTGCVFHQGGRYRIFVDENACPKFPSSLSPFHKERLIALEEYAHAMHGDVYDDNPAAMLARTTQQQDEAERYARGYATERLA